MVYDTAHPFSLGYMLAKHDKSIKSLHSQVLKPKGSPLVFLLQVVPQCDDGSVKFHIGLRAYNPLNATGCVSGFFLLVTPISNERIFLEVLASSSPRLPPHVHGAD